MPMRLRSYLPVFVALLCLVSLFSHSLRAQTPFAPSEKNLTDFGRQFPDAKDVSWDSADGGARVQFLSSGFFYTVEWNSSGVMKHLEYELDQEDLPALVARKITGKWKDSYFEHVVWRKPHHSRGYYFLTLQSDSSTLFLRISRWGKVLERKEVEFKPLLRP